MIPAYSPQPEVAGVGTWQGRLAAGAAAARDHDRGRGRGALREHYITEFNAFSAAPAQRGSAFLLPCSRKNLDLIFSLQLQRTVNRDNTVSFQNLQPDSGWLGGTLAGWKCKDHQHLDGTISLTHGPPPDGALWTPRCGHHVNAKRSGQERCGKDAPWKSPKTDFSAALEIPPSTRDSHFPTATTGYWFMSETQKLKPDISLATKSGQFNLLRTLTKVHASHFWHVL